MTTPTLASRLVAGIRFISGLYRTGVHTREDVLAQRFSVICTGSYQDHDEGGDWTLLATVTVGHCALLEEAIKMARSYLKRGCFVFDYLTYDRCRNKSLKGLSLRSNSFFAKPRRNTARR